MNRITTISFVRHGHVLDQGVFYGRLTGFVLSEKGRDQAAAAAKLLKNKPIQAVFSSPLLRARQTAKIILCYHPELTLKLSQLLNEVCTPFDGCPHAILDARKWDVYTGIGAPYEQPEDVLDRTRRFIARVRRHYAGQHVVAVTHGDTLAFLILWAGGIPITPKYKMQLRRAGIAENYPSHASITTLRFKTGAADELPSLEYVNPTKS